MNNQRPNFLVIGAGRAGTTWLYRNLKATGKVYLPPLKELHYFDRALCYPSPSFLHNAKFIQRLFSVKQHNILFKQLFLKALISPIRKLSVSDLQWALRFFTGTINDEWYINLFNQAKNIPAGEITPAYQLLNENDIAKVNKLLPCAKIIFIIRNPIDRTWSQLRKNNQANCTDQEIIKLLEHDDMKLRNDYIRTFKSWAKYYAENQIKVYYFDEIQTNPERLLKKVLSFILNERKVELSLDLTSMLKKKIYSINYQKIAPEKRLLLIDQLSQKMLDHSRFFGGYCSQWLKEENNYKSGNIAKE